MAPTTRPIVFMDINIGETPAGRMKMELFSDVVPKCVNFTDLCIRRCKSNLLCQGPLRISVNCVLGNIGMCCHIFPNNDALKLGLDSVNSRPQGFKNATFHRYGITISPRAPLTPYVCAPECKQRYSFASNEPTLVIAESRTSCVKASFTGQPISYVTEPIFFIFFIQAATFLGAMGRVLFLSMATNSLCVYSSSLSIPILMRWTKDENFEIKHTGPGLLSMVCHLSSFLN